MSITIVKRTPPITLEKVEADADEVLENLKVKKKAVPKKSAKKVAKKAVKKTVKKAIKKAVKKVAKKKAVKKAATKRSLVYKTDKSLQGRRSSDNGKNLERDVVKFFRPLNAIRVGGQGDNALRKSFDAYMCTESSGVVSAEEPEVVVECKLRKKLTLADARKFLTKLNNRFDKKESVKVLLLCMREGRKPGFYVFFENNMTRVPTLTCVHSSNIKFRENASVFDFVS